MKRIILTGGGTAGHVNPNIALIPKLQKEGWEIFYIGSSNGIEKKLIQEVRIKYFEISTGKLRRYLHIKNITDIFKVISGISDSKKLIKKIKPDLIFSKGGFVGVPVVIAAKMEGIPVIVHESDFSPGLANKLAIPLARTVCVTFPETLDHIKNNKGVLTGNPIRDQLFRGDKDTGKKICNFSDSKPVILIMGGSQGASAINEVVRNSISKLLADYNIVHLCGKDKIDYSLQNINGYVQFEYLNEELSHIFAITDIAVSRAGSNSITELAALCIPSLLIPLSLKASRGDQILNANSFMKQNFCMVLQEEQLTTGSLISNVNKLYSNRLEYIQSLNRSSFMQGVNNVINEIRKFKK